MYYFHRGNESPKVLREDADKTSMTGETKTWGDAPKKGKKMKAVAVLVLVVLAVAVGVHFGGCAGDTVHKQGVERRMVLDSIN